MSALDKSTKDLVLDKIVGKMYWHGDTYEDDESLKNMEVGYEIALAIIDGIYDNATLANNALATSSGEMLNKRAKDMLEYIKTICDEVDYER